MTEEEYRRLRNLLDTVVEQQALTAENYAKADMRMTRHETAIAALLTIAETHEREINANGEQMKASFAEAHRKTAETDALLKSLAEKTAETDERLNALISVVERIVSKNQ